MAKSAWGLLSFLSFIRFVCAIFTYPDATEDDFAYYFYNGDVIEITWEGWPSSLVASRLGSPLADLYVAAWNFDSYSYSKMLSTEQYENVSEAGSYTWRIDIDEYYLDETSQYGFFFIDGASDYTGDPDLTLQTKGFYITKPLQASSSSATPSATSTPAASGSTGPTSTPTSTPTDAASSDTDSEPELLSRKEAAGIGAGVGVACSAIGFGIAFFYLRRRRQRKNAVPETTETSAAYAPAPTDQGPFEASSDGQTNRDSQMTFSSSQGYPQTPVYYQAYKPGPHEMPAEPVSVSPPPPPAELSSEPHLR